MPVRHGDRTVYLPSEDAYGLINEGLRARASAQITSGRTTRDMDEEAEQALDVIDRLQDWEETPALYWQSLPLQAPDILPGLHSDKAIRGRIQNQSVLRHNGFNFANYYGKLRVYEGGLMLNQTRSAVWVRPDGLMTAGAVANSELPCWGMESYSRPHMINLFVLAELTLEYVRLADELVVQRVSGGWRHRVVARRFQGVRPRLLCSGMRGHGHKHST